MSTKLEAGEKQCLMSPNNGVHYFTPTHRCYYCSAIDPAYTESQQAEAMPQKPPLGIIPRGIWIEHRQEALVEAMARAYDACPPNADNVAEWAREYVWLEDVKRQRV